MLASNNERRGTSLHNYYTSPTKQRDSVVVNATDHNHQLVENSLSSFLCWSRSVSFFLFLALSVSFVRSVRAKRIYLYIYKEVCVLRGIGFRRFQCLRDFPERLVHGLVSLIPESDPVGRFPVFDRHRERHRLSDDVRLWESSVDLDHEIR